MKKRGWSWGYNSNFKVEMDRIGLKFKSSRAMAKLKQERFTVIQQQLEDDDSSMASLTLSLCSNFSTHCRISTKLNVSASTPIPPSNSHHDSFNFPISTSSSSLKLSPSSIPSSRPTFPFVLKSSESEVAVIESEPAAASQIVEIPSEEAPKREEIFAVVMVSVYFPYTSFFRFVYCLKWWIDLLCL